MRRFTLLSFVGVAMLALSAATGFSQDSMTMGKKGEVELSADTRIGSTTLTPGRYVLQHRVIDGYHYLVVRSETAAHATEDRSLPLGWRDSR